MRFSHARWPFAKSIISAICPSRKEEVTWHRRRWTFNVVIAQVGKLERQNRRPKQAALLTLVLLGVLLMMAQSRSPNEPAPARVLASEKAGRFQIVNGTPGYARNIMLLDTETGASWLTCNGEEGATGWCSLPRWSGTTKVTEK